MDRHALYNQMAARLRDHVANGTTDNAADTLRVPATQYTDADVWQREMDGILRPYRFWSDCHMKFPKREISKPLIFWVRLC